MELLDKISYQKKWLFFLSQKKREVKKIFIFIFTWELIWLHLCKLQNSLSIVKYNGV